MSNHFGGVLVMTGGWDRLSTEGTGMKTINIKNEDANGVIALGRAEGEQTGYLNGGEAKAYQYMRPADIYVLGTAGQKVYWDGNA